MKATFLRNLPETLADRIRSVDAGPRGDLRLVADNADAIPLLVNHLRLAHQARVVAVFGEDRRSAEGVFLIYHVLEQPGQRHFLILQTPVSAEEPRFPSLAGDLPSVNWQEREIQDWLGVEAAGHPNPRRVALHDNWPDVHPLCKDFPLQSVLPPLAGDRHVYRPTLGEGVLQIPVGPVHAGIIEPGHFNFAVAGEPILYLQLRMFYKHKGIEKLFEHIPLPKAVFLAESISGDSAFSHAAAFCQAIESAAGIETPPRALGMRTILLELERIVNHVGDLGAIANDVAFTVAHMHAGRLREMMLSLGEDLTGSRMLRGMMTIGGVRFDWKPEQLQRLQTTLEIFQREFLQLVALLHSSASTRDRLEHTGILQPAKARDLGIVGVAGRASGIDIDVRRDHPYAAYAEAEFRVPVYEAGDVLHRLLVRIDETLESVKIIRQLAAKLPPGAHQTAWQEIPPDRCALGVVEGWRGEILHWVRTAPGNRLERCKVKDPSLNNWPALVEAVQGNIIADFPVINKSFNLSYSGTDR